MNEATQKIKEALLIAVFSLIFWAAVVALVLWALGDPEMDAACRHDSRCEQLDPAYKGSCHCHERLSVRQNINIDIDIDN